MSKVVTTSQSKSFAPLSESTQLSSIYRKVLESQQSWNKQREEWKADPYGVFLGPEPLHYSRAIEVLEDTWIEPLHEHLARAMQRPADAVEIGKALSILVTAFPNAAKADLSGFGQILTEFVCEAPSPTVVLDMAVKTLIQTRKFLPSVAEVLGAIAESGQHLKRLECELAHRRKLFGITDERWIEAYIAYEYPTNGPRHRNWPADLGPAPGKHDCWMPRHIPRTKEAQEVKAASEAQYRAAREAEFQARSQPVRDEAEERAAHAKAIQDMLAEVEATEAAERAHRAKAMQDLAVSAVSENGARSSASKPQPATKPNTADVRVEFGAAGTYIHVT